jgi:hypothetical protein
LVKRYKEGEANCYLSVPANVDTGALRSVLTDLGVSVDPAAELPPPGESFPGEIRRRLREADFVCGVLLDEAPAATNVAFELGIAAGLGRPIFVIASTKELFPFGLQAFPHVQGSAADIDAIRFHLAAFLKNMKQSTHAVLAKAKPAKQRPAPRFGTIADLRRRAQEPSTSEAEVMQVVSQALMVLGAEVSVDKKMSHGSRPDIIAWLPDTATDIGGPIVVEVKRARGWPRQQMTAQIERYMAAAGARTALIVVPGLGPDVEVKIVAGGYLFVLSLETLLDLAESGRLNRSLIEERNRFVHTGR